MTVATAQDADDLVREAIALCVRASRILEDDAATDGA